jgi:hypothetical protein
MARRTGLESRSLQRLRNLGAAVRPRSSPDDRLYALHEQLLQHLLRARLARGDDALFACIGTYGNSIICATHASGA